MTDRQARARMGFGVAFGVSLVVLLAHAWLYRFLCDDAFISFRYAHNLASGQGLVFNPGGAAVEGYTNFLWVVILAAFDAAGTRPETIAPVLSLLLTVVLWWLVSAAAWRWLPAEPWRPAVVLPAVWLGLTRSVAVWSTSGLETRLFEVLVVAGVLRTIDDVAEALRDAPRRAPIGALLFALAALTRPDGMLLAGAVLGTAAVLLAARRKLRVADVATQALVIGGIVGAHLLFRHAYYGEWVPNTYFAKVSGRSWWSMGAAYLACCTLEYAAWLWIPLLASGVSGFVEDRKLEAPLLIAAAVVPHAIYVASIGGDHFEFRPLDLYFPLLFLLMARGMAALSKGVLSRRGVFLYSGAVALGLIAIPLQSHRQFPHEYNVGFPGLGAVWGERESFLDPSKDPVYRWPGVRLLADAHRALLRNMTSRLVGVRQEEHALFLDTVVPEGRRLRAMVASGTLPPDTHVAMSAVGAIPYYSNLRVLDRLGLTDATVARSAPGAWRVMAHDRHATLSYAAESGVDFWTEDPVHLLQRVDRDLVFAVEAARSSGEDVYYADAGSGDFIVARLPQGLDRTEPRFPGLAFHAVRDGQAYEALLDQVIELRKRELVRDPKAHDARVALGHALAARGRDAEALPVFQALADENDIDGWYNLGVILSRRGDSDDAERAFRKAVAIEPAFSLARHNLGLLLARTGRVKEALVELREAERLEPYSEAAIYTLGVALLMAGDNAGAAACRRQLEELGTPQSAALAQKLTQGASGAPSSAAP